MHGDCDQCDNVESEGEDTYVSDVSMIVSSTFLLLY